MRINCVGELLVDMIGQKGKNLKENDRFHRRAGGAPANVAVAASKLGADVFLTSTVGDDVFGDFLIQKVGSMGVNTQDIVQISENTSLAFVALTDGSEPEFSFNRGADKFIDQEISKDADILHVGSLPLTRSQTAENIIETLDNYDGKISFDPNLRDGILTQEYLKQINRVIERTDILFAEEEELNELGGANDILSQVNEIVESKGEEGAQVKTSEMQYSELPPNVNVVDTTGAGDALTGAYLAFRDKGKKKALKKAVSAAALSIQEKGAMSALPNKERLKNSLES